MGVVYEAEDSKLGRRVALKFLSESNDASHAIIERFLREARTASALNHPNICTIHEIGEADSKPFIAMELLEGQSLDHALRGRRLALDAVLEIGIQMADGLEAAHAKGIIHRDIKPGNLFLNQRGQLKILDFGLAKVDDGDPGSFRSGSTIGLATAENLTSPGTAVGTISYMSPEQARGEEIDRRSDLFSAGSVLYEMVSGKLPFPGKTSAVVFESILNRDPVPLAQLNSQAPEELQRIIEKCLEKNPDVRYQSAAELRVDLKRLKRDTDSGRRALSASSSAGPSNEATSTRRGTDSSASSSVVEAAKKHRIGIASISALLVVASALGIYALLHRPARAPLQDPTLARITSSGDASAAAISVDGKYMAYIRREPNGQSGLWMRHLPTSSNAQLIAPDDSAYYDIRFGPEGNYVYYRADVASRSHTQLFRVPVLGGTPVPVIDNIDSAPSFSPDGQRFCFMRGNSPKPGQEQIISVGVEGGNETVLVTGNTGTLRTPAWSPDGRKVVFASTSETEPGTLTALDLATGARSTFFRFSQMQEALSTVWTPDGHGVIIAFRDVVTGQTQLGYISYPRGEFRKITNDLNYYRDVSLTTDGRTLATALVQPEFVIQLFPADGVMDDSHAQSLGPAKWLDWLDASHVLAFEGSDGGISAIALPSGTRSSLYRNDSVNSLDGHSCAGPGIAFSGIPKENTAVGYIYGIDANGGNLQQLSPGPDDQYFRCSPDGRWLVYSDQSERSIKKIPLAGGKSEILIPKELGPDNQFDITKDSKELIVLLHGSRGPILSFASLESGKIAQQIPLTGNPNYLASTPDGKGVAYVDRVNGSVNIWVQPRVGGKPYQLSKFVQAAGPSKGIHGAAWSPDGKMLALVRTTVRSDVVILQDQTK